MPDLGKTDAQWLTATNAQGFGLRAARYLEDAARRFDRKRTQLVVVSRDQDPFETPHSANALTGVAYGTNTDANGDLWVRLATGTPNTVSLYSATGASGLVAQGTANDGATATMTAQNSSGLSGTLRLSSTVTAITDDTVRIRVLQDFPLETLDLWDDSGEDDGKSRAAAERMCTSIANGIRSQINGAVNTFFREIAISAADNPKPQIKAFLESDETTLFSEVVENDGSDNISRTEVGVWALQKQAMADETTGSTQDITQRVVSRSAGVADTNNTGSATIASGTAEDRAKLGKFTLECTSGLGNGGGGSEEFSGKFVATNSDFTSTFSGLVIGKTFALPHGGGTITMVRSLTKTGDGSNADVGAASTFSATGENETNTDSGLLYGTVTANGSNWDIEFYSDSARSSLVAQATNVATAASSQTASAQNGSGLTITFDVGSGPTDTNTFTIDLNYHSVSNSVNQKDRYTFSTTETSSGYTARVLAEVFDAEWNGIASSPQLADGPLAIQGVFADRMADDI